MRPAQEALCEMARAGARAVLDEPSSKEMLAAYGIATPRSLVIRRPDDIAAALAKVGLPVALKLVSPDAVHKSEVGGVRLGLADVAATALAMGEMESRATMLGLAIAGYLVEEMIAPGHEVMIGGVRDPRFGPIVMFGIGGVFVEILGDISLRLCPIDRMEAIEMIRELRGAPALFGARGGLEGREDALVDALLALGGEHGLLVEHEDVEELDINPLILGASGIVAVDARIVLRSR